MSVLKYPGICEYCEAGLICASGNWSSVRYTRCRYCNVPVIVFHDADDIRKETAIVIANECPMPFSGSYTICGSEKCLRENYDAYRRAQQTVDKVKALPGKR
jgi:hypothetical protein